MKTEARRTCPTCGNELSGAMEFCPVCMLRKGLADGVESGESSVFASVRHPNVASVFHLGRTGENYFYAMEFVQGETLEKLIKRSGRVEVKLALEIATQVATGLAAVHKQKLVHRDIKPSNIIVSIEEGSTVTVKIIDLGLAKPSPDAPAEAAISIPGAFAGTPEFASPEQFAGVGVDTRSDLYSLGVTLWEMLTGRTPFRGTPEGTGRAQNSPSSFRLLNQSYSIRVKEPPPERSSSSQLPIFSPKNLSPLLRLTVLIPFDPEAENEWPNLHQLSS